MHVFLMTLMSLVSRSGFPVEQMASTVCLSSLGFIIWPSFSFFFFFFPPEEAPDEASIFVSVSPPMSLAKVLNNSVISVQKYAENNQCITGPLEVASEATPSPASMFQAVGMDHLLPPPGRHQYLAPLGPGMFDDRKDDRVRVIKDLLDLFLILGGEFFLFMTGARSKSTFDFYILKYQRYMK